MRSHDALARVPLLPGMLILCLAFATAGARADSGTRPVAPGELFPATSHTNLNVASGGPTQIDLADYLGQKPIILYYWIALNTRSEEVFQQLQELVQEVGGDRIALFGLAVPRPPALGVDKIRERLTALGIRVPVLEDEGFRLGKRLLVSSVPNITIIDGEGRLRLSNGASLRQVLGYELDLSIAIRRTAETGKLLTHGYLDRYFPVRELEGEPSPDFKAPLLENNVEQRWHSLIDDSKLNVLIFWSVDCAHCRQALPEINRWLEAHPDGINVVSCASVASEAARIKTREFCKLNGFRFPTLMDSDARIDDLYRITTTPTIVIIRPDGVVDSTIISGLTDFGQTIEAKKKQLLGARASD